MTNDKNPNPRDDALTQDILDKLSQPLPKAAVKTRPGANRQTFRYIPSHIAIALANHIFTAGNWDRHIHEIGIDRNEKDQPIGCYAIVSVSIHSTGTSYADIGYSGISTRNGAPVLTAEEFDKCRKGAVSDATKRCLRLFGDALGNSLYESEADREQFANHAIDAWIDAGLDKDQAYQQVVSNPERKRTSVPISVSLQQIDDARKSQIRRKR